MNLKHGMLLPAGLAVMIGGVFLVDFQTNESVASSTSPPSPVLGTTPGTVAVVAPAAFLAPDEAGLASVRLTVRDGRVVSGPSLIKVRSGTHLAVFVDSDQAGRFGVSGYGVGLQLESSRTGTLAFEADKPGRYDFTMGRENAVVGGLDVAAQ